MPRRLTRTKPGTHQVLKNIAFESTVISWLMQDGWQVFSPIVDNGHKTELLISDGPNYYRIQIKTIEAKSNDQWLQNSWNGSDVNIIIVFARNSNWGIIAPAFIQKRRRLNHDEHIRFMRTQKDFLREFHKFDV